MSVGALVFAIAGSRIGKQFEAGNTQTMAITDILSSAQGGQYFANVAKASGLSTAKARAVVSKFAPAIAAKVKEKAAADPDAFDALLDILEEGGDSSDLDDVEALTGVEAREDGADILANLYGSQVAAEKSLGARGDSESIAAALSATGVLAALAATNASTLTSDATQASSGGGGLIAIIIAAILKGLMQGARRQLAPKRRRRRYSYSTRRRTTRRRTTRPGLDDVFREILAGRK